MAERLSGRMSKPATWSLRAGNHTLAWSPNGLTGSPELVDAVQAMAERSERVLVTPTGPTLKVHLSEPLSVLVAASQVLRSLGVTDAIETEGRTPAYPGLPLGAVG
jgi:hypothetical protein